MHSRKWTCDSDDQIYLHAWIIETRSNRIDGQRIAIVVLQVITSHSMYRTLLAKRQGSCIVWRVETPSSWLYANQLHTFVTKKGGKDACTLRGKELGLSPYSPYIFRSDSVRTNRIATSSNASHDCVGKLAFLFEELPPSFFADNALEIANHSRKGMRSNNRADGVKEVHWVFLHKRKKRMSHWHYHRYARFCRKKLTKYSSKAESTASFNVRVPRVTETRLQPRIFIFVTLGCSLSVNIDRFS